MLKLFFIKYAFYTLRNSCHYFIRNCIPCFSNLSNAQLFTKYQNFCTNFTIYLSDIDHHHIHTNRTNNRSFFIVYNYISNFISTTDDHNELQSRHYEYTCIISFKIT